MPLITEKMRSPSESQIVLFPGKSADGEDAGKVRKEWGDMPSGIVINPDFLKPSQQSTVSVSTETRNLVGEDVSRASNNEMEILPELPENKENRPSNEEIFELIKQIESNEKKK
jgi:hypothetical protein